MIIAQTFFDEFHPGEIVPPTRYAPAAIEVMAGQGMVRLAADPEPEPKPKPRRSKVEEETNDAD